MADFSFDAEIFSVGHHAGRDWSLDDLHALARNFELLRGHVTPAIKLGHGAQLFQGAPSDGIASLGWVDAVRVVGRKLVATITGVPQALAELVKTARYRRCSAELYPRWQDTSWEANLKTGATGPVLAGLALLGDQAPEVKDLRDLAALLACEPAALALTAPTEGVLRVELAMPAPDPQIEELTGWLGNARADLEAAVAALAALPEETPGDRDPGMGVVEHLNRAASWLAQVSARVSVVSADRRAEAQRQQGQDRPPGATLPGQNELRLKETPMTNPTPEAAAAEVDVLAKKFCQQRDWCWCQLHADSARRQVVEPPRHSELFSENPPPDYSHLDPDRVHGRMLREGLTVVCKERGIDPACIDGDNDPALMKQRARALRLLATREEYAHLRPRHVEYAPVEQERRPFTELRRTPVTLHCIDSQTTRREGGHLAEPGLRSLEEIVLEDGVRLGDAKTLHYDVAAEIRRLEETLPFRWDRDAPRMAALICQRKPELRLAFSQTLRPALQPSQVCFTADGSR